MESEFKKRGELHSRKEREGSLRKKNIDVVAQKKVVFKKEALEKKKKGSRE